MRRGLKKVLGFESLPTQHTVQGATTEVPNPCPKFWDSPPECGELSDVPAMLEAMTILGLASAGNVTPAVLWDGFLGALAGALVGGLVSAYVAWRVVVATQRGAERSELRKASRDAAAQLTLGFNEVRQNLNASVGSNFANRAEVRRSVAFELAQLVHLHRPILLDSNLQATISDAQRVILDFLGRARDRDNAIARPPERPSFPAFENPDPWLRPALDPLSEYISEVVARLELHRRGHETPKDAPPVPVYPTLTEILDADSHSSLPLPGTTPPEPN
jgi:hypothetical protein